MSKTSTTKEYAQKKGSNNAILLRSAGKVVEPERQSKTSQTSKTKLEQKTRRARHS
jgi:hypothetical protein